jgi:hypothetical protein
MSKFMNFVFESSLLLKLIFLLSFSRFFIFYVSALLLFGIIIG